MTEVRQTRRRTAHRRALLAGSAAWCALAAAPLAAQQGGFQLPPSPQETPRVQGPVVEGAPAPRVVQPTATPTPVPTPRATPTPPPRIPTPTPTPAPTASPARPQTPLPTPRTATPAPAPRITATPPRATPTPSPTPSPSATPSIAVLPEPVPSAAPAIPVPETAAPAASPPPAPSAPQAAGTWPWYWLALPLGLLLAAGAAIAAIVRRRRTAEPDMAVPEIERPRVPPPPQPEQAQLPLEPAPQPPIPPVPPTPTPAALAEAPEGPLSIAIEARQLSISLTAATLAYRVTLTNTARTSLRDITISGDMISAHSSIPEEDQVASAAIALEERHKIERIPAGETTQLTGEFRLPFTSIRAIRQGGAALFVPLARLKAEVAQGGNGPVVQTALVGQRAEKAGGGLLPFRLDLGPRIYREVTQRIFS